MSKFNKGDKMNISLTPELDQLVKNKVKSGLYNSASEVVREALRLLLSHDEIRNKQLEALQRDVQKGVASLDAGEGVEMTDELFDSIKKRGAQRLKETKE